MDEDNVINANSASERDVRRIMFEWMLERASPKSWFINRLHRPGGIFEISSWTTRRLVASRMVCGPSPLHASWGGHLRPRAYSHYIVGDRLATPKVHLSGVGSTNTRDLCWRAEGEKGRRRMREYKRVDDIRLFDNYQALLLSDSSAIS